MAFLSVRQRSFIEEYLKDFSPQKAAERAGYHKNYGSALLRQEAVKNEMERRRSLGLSNEGMVRERLLGELASIAFAHESEGFKLADKFKALELLGKQLGMFGSKNGGAAPCDEEIGGFSDSEAARLDMENIEISELLRLAFGHEEKDES